MYGAEYVEGEALATGFALGLALWDVALAFEENTGWMLRRSKATVRSLLPR